MGATPDRNAIVERYNESCVAFQAASEGWRQGNLGLYESKLRQSAIAAVGALEWALQVYIHDECAVVLSEEDQVKLTTGNFHHLLEFATRASPPLTETIRSRFREYRKLRNFSEHGGTIPTNATVLAALTDIRRFLVERLLIAPERLRSATPVEASHQATSEGMTTETSASSTYGHREVGAGKWVAEVLEAGIAQARRVVGERYDATLDSLSIEAKSLLMDDALVLALSGSPPDAIIHRSTESAEEEMQRILRTTTATGLGAAGVERLQRLLPLVSRRGSLCVEAGFLQRQEDGLRFSHRLLPVLLVGRAIATRPEEATQLRAIVVAHCAWGEAAWAAVAEGDDADEWTALLAKQSASPALLDCVVATCGALGALAPNMDIPKLFVESFRLCATTLIWFAPLRIGAFKRAMERDSPWFLPKDIWQRCLLDLAHAAECFPDEARLAMRLADCQLPPEPLQHLVSTLNLSLRLPEDVITGLLMFCAPGQTLRGSPLVGDRFNPLFRLNSGVDFESSSLTTWFLLHGLSAMYSVDRATAARLLALPAENHPAGFLLHRPELLDAWWSAWQLLAADDVETAAEAFVKALQFLRDRSDEKTLKIVTKGFQKLERRRLSDQVAARLRDTLKPIGLDPKTPNPPTTVAIQMLRHAAPPSAELAKLVEEWTQEPALAWRTLLEAGTPDTAIARWCIAKLSKREKVPAGLREGPHAIVSGGVVTQSNDWQLAFEQAPEALEWLLSEGSAESINVLADACLGGEDPTRRVDPIVGKWQAVHLSIPLSQVLWGRVLGRKAGREAFLSFVERGNDPGGGPHFLDSKSLPSSEDSLWLQVAMGIADPCHGNQAEAASSSESEPRPDGEVPSWVQKDAQRLLRAFEQRLAVAPWLANLNGNPVRAAVTVNVALCGVDVSAVLRSLIQEMLSIKVQSRETAVCVAILCNALSSSLFHLYCHHPSQAVPILDAALDAPMLTAMRQDDTRLFWLALVHRHGAAKVLGIVDELAWLDIGLGLFDALHEIDASLLHQRHLRPELLRSTLIRSAQMKFRPAPEFWKEAWTTERSETEIPELVQFSGGDWLTHLLDNSTKWSVENRARLLRHLALYSNDDAVRSRCTAALCER